MCLEYRFGHRDANLALTQENTLPLLTYYALDGQLFTSLHRFDGNFGGFFLWPALGEVLGDGSTELIQGLREKNPSHF